MKYTPERAESIIQSIRDGNYNEIAARANGVSKSTFYEWMASKPEFSDSVRGAQAEAEQDYVKLMKTHADQSHQAAGWWLSRKFPERWSEKHIIETQERKPDLSNLSEDEKREMWRLHKKLQDSNTTE